MVACAALSAAAVGLGGCGLRLQLVDASVRKPSNVAVYFTVDTHGGEPVADLTPGDFRIYEDGQPVSILESKQTILQEQVAAIHYTLLLVDMSGSVVDSGDMPALVQAAQSFADRVGPYQKVAVYTFDGSPHLTPLVGFGGNIRAGVSALATRRPRDPSTNLNGGVIEGVRVLSQQMDHAPVPLRFGTLVVFTDGTDRAHRATAEDVGKALDGAGFETYVIGVGQEVDRAQLSKIGRSGTFASQNRADVQKGFDEIAARIEAASKRYYLLSYCSPSRAGAHDVEVEANARGASGRLQYHFEASGFGPNCDPNQRPSFDVHHPRNVPPDRVAPERAEARPATPPSQTFSRPSAENQPPKGPGWQPAR
ncbi:MAG TPA: VWA domain-containing protein [Polyangia bacterium]|nr:VWA domain-containing protein [Polyangia bacterium]